MTSSGHSEPLPSAGRDEWAIGYPDGDLVEFGTSESEARRHYAMQKDATWLGTGDPVSPRLLRREKSNTTYVDVSDRKHERQISISLHRSRTRRRRRFRNIQIHR